MRTKIEELICGALTVSILTALVIKTLVDAACDYHQRINSVGTKLNCIATEIPSSLSIFHVIAFPSSSSSHSRFSQTVRFLVTGVFQTLAPPIIIIFFFFLSLHAVEIPSPESSLALDSQRREQRKRREPGEREVWGEEERVKGRGVFFFLLLSPTECSALSFWGGSGKRERKREREAATLDGGVVQ